MENEDRKSSVEISKNGKGEYSFSVKVVNEDPDVSRNKALDLAKKLTDDCKDLSQRNQI